MSTTYINHQPSTAAAATTTKKYLLKIILVGDSGVGKTSLLSQYVHKRYIQQHKATIGVDFLTKDLIITTGGNEKVAVTLQIWDTAGQERFQSLGSAFYRGADCCILTYDVNDVGSFEHLERWKNDFVNQAAPPASSSSSSSPNSHIPYQLVVVGNKVDLENQRCVSQKRAQAWCSNNSILSYYETSATNSKLVEETFESIAKQLVLAIEKQFILPFQSISPDSNSSGNKVDINSNIDNNNNGQNKKSCC